MSEAPHDTLPPARLQVIHRVPGRLRVAVVPAEGKTLDDLVAAAGRLRGVKEAALGASRRNLVVRFDDLRVDEQTLLMRLALALSSMLSYRPVQVLTAQRGSAGLSPVATVAGLTAAGSSALRLVAPGAAITGLSGWVGALLTLATVGHETLNSLANGKARPEGLSVLHLLSRLGGPGRSSGSLLTWLLFHGDAVAERFRGRHAEGVELRPVAVRGGVADDDEGTHLEIVTRPIRTRGQAEGRLLTPATIASALIGYVAYALRQDGS